MVSASSLKKIVLPFFILLALPLTIFLVFHNTDSRQRASQEVIAYLVPDTTMAKPGETITYTLAVDSHSTPVKSAQVNLAYPGFKGEITTIETSKSPFDLPLEQIKGNGILKLGRETTTPVYGLQQIATIQLKATNALEASEVTLAPGSYILTLDNTTISPQGVIRQFPESSKEEKQSFIDQLLERIRNIFP